MSEISDNRSETMAERRAQMRRQKIMSESDIRIKKILSINEKQNDKQMDQNCDQNYDNYDQNSDHKTDNRFGFNSDTNNGIKESINEKVLKEFGNCGQLLTQTANDLLKDNSINELRHRFNGGLDWQSSESTTESQSIDRTFPRKVSLISTPIDFKTLQQSHQNNTTSLASNLIWLLCQNLTQLSVITVLLLVALFGSLFRLNFVLPFFVTQLFRLLIVFFSHKNSGSNKTINHFLIVLSVLQHLIVFVFTYILVQIFI